jgi:hypothetical protein
LLKVQIHEVIAATTRRRRRRSEFPNLDRGHKSSILDGA